MSFAGSTSLRSLADGLTGLRMVLAVAVVPAAWASRLGLTAIIVATAWLTDLVDGRLARLSGEKGRLASWDLRADTMLGACLLVGLAGAGIAPLWLIPLAVALAALYLLGSVSASMLLQLCGYVPLLVVLWTDRPPAWWLPVVVPLLIGLIDWRRLLTVNIPVFLDGFQLGLPHRRR